MQRTTTYDRHDRIISLYRELAAQFIKEEANTDPLITVTRTATSGDFSRATIFVTVYPEQDEERALHFLKRKGGELRHLVKKKGNLKIIPFFEFAIDLGEKNRQRMDEIAGEN